jgi:hypothetical protein
MSAAYRTDTVDLLALQQNDGPKGNTKHLVCSYPTYSVPASHACLLWSLYIRMCQNPSWVFPGNLHTQTSASAVRRGSQESKQASASVFPDICIQKMPGMNLGRVSSYSDGSVPVSWVSPGDWLTHLKQILSVWKCSRTRIHSYRLTSFNTAELWLPQLKDFKIKN